MKNTKKVSTMLVLAILLMSVMNFASADLISKDFVNTSCELSQADEELITYGSEIRSARRYFSISKPYHLHEDIPAKIYFKRIKGDYIYSGNLKRRAVKKDGDLYRVKFAGYLEGHLFR